MRLSKKQQKLWIVIVAIASLALILTSFLPVIYSIIR